MVDRDSVLLELAAADDLAAFRFAIEDGGLDPSGVSPWYGRWSGRMAFALRSPLMIAAMYGSAAVLNYLLTSVTAVVDLVDQASPSDGFTAVHCAAACGSRDVVDLLLAAAGRPPRDAVSPKFKSPKKEFPPDVTLPDINAGVFSTDEFRMYAFKIKPCSRAYSHDWTECPFAHPGENARRRDPRKFSYSCVPCPEFRKGTCRHGDACEYAHGVFESWLHPAQYRTRLCKDEARCTRRVCFFAHRHDELRAPAAAPLTRSTPAVDLSMLEPIGLPPRPASRGPTAVAAAFAKRSQSFCDRGRPRAATVTPANYAPSPLSGWGSPGGKLDWGVQGDELGRLRRSVSFADQGPAVDEPDLSWVQSLVKDGPPASPWFDQMFFDQQQMVA